MTLVKPFAITSSAIVPAAWKNRPRVEKICLSSKLDGERRRTQQQEDFASAKAMRTQLYRNETSAVAPEWDEQILTPAFVAQVLGQAMAGSVPETSSALLAYRSHAAQVAPVYDRNM